MHPHMPASSRREANQALYGRVSVHVSDPHASTQEGQLLFLHRRAKTIAGGAELGFLGVFFFFFKHGVTSAWSLFSCAM